MAAAPRSASPPPRAAVGKAGRDGWVPPGAAVTVGSLTLPGGMLYVGRQLPAAVGYGPDPALIDPRLPLDFRRPDWAAGSVGYWPSYSDITPGARAAYLTWLADGRRAPNAPISWPFLFFYGLERRVLVDAAKGQDISDELPAIAAEVRRLLDLYGDNGSFRGYTTRFLQLLDFYATSTGDVSVPARTGNPWDVPMALRVGLGEQAVDGTPISADWALAWAYYHPEIYLRTPATRCAAEFEALFRTRYAERHGPGLTIKATTTRLKLDYYSASAGIGQAELSTTLPDVLTQAGPSKKLAALVEECTASLDAYSRFLGRNPDARGTLPAAALLPPELADNAGGDDLARLNSFVNAALDGQPSAVVDAGELLAFWPLATPGKVAKAEAVTLAQLLSARGIGLEPDVRHGGPVPDPVGVVVLFRAEPGQPASPSPEYQAAALLMHLASVVSTADGHASDAEISHLVAHLEAAMGFGAAERARLEAHLRWLLATPVKLTGLTKRLAALDQGQRENIGDFLTTVAATDGHVSPEEIKILTRIFKLLGLDPASVYSRVHAATTGGVRIAAVGPVTVRASSPGAHAYAIPPAPAARPDPSASRDLAAPVQLDAATVAAKLAETAAVTALLGSIFTDEEPTPPLLPAATGHTIAGLDAAHSTLLTVLAGRGSWARAELEAECAGLGLLPDGAVDTLNEAAYERVGDPLVDGDDPITIDPGVAQEMQA
ncbi:TerB N-terminal domain-containing protein [Blastococcus sp. BMG 814]|uniref:TerB N-terminal domain-containing protein n=1 Tax=Blastococcus carthaginiensis TaxID=3050034 RepID=A0ABT9IB82_9ACTN|nr:TerB N-terminal domain-containing protein [Blastococcus carthaginiensis]